MTRAHYETTGERPVRLRLMVEDELDRLTPASPGDVRAFGLIEAGPVFERLWSALDRLVEPVGDLEATTSLVAAFMGLVTQALEGELSAGALRDAAVIVRAQALVAGVEIDEERLTRCVACWEDEHDRCSLDYALCPCCRDTLAREARG